MLSPSCCPWGGQGPLYRSWVSRRDSLFVLRGWNKGSFTQEYSYDLMFPPRVGAWAVNQAYL